jgi:phosphohistidine swiveling domain-containing protein
VGGYGSTWAYREGVGAERSGGGLGKFTIAGRVVDADGNAVVDAEVMVGKTVVYTRANGEFELTVRKRKAYAVVVEGWKVISGAEIEAGEAVTIVVDD